MNRRQLLKTMMVAPILALVGTKLSRSDDWEIGRWTTLKDGAWWNLHKEDSVFTLTKEFPISKCASFQISLKTGECETEGIKKFCDMPEWMWDKVPNGKWQESAIKVTQPGWAEGGHCLLQKWKFLT